MEPIYLTADRLFDGTGTATLVRPLVSIVDGRIDSVQRGLLAPPTCTGERADFPGCTILPGLIDTHVHLIFSAADTNEEVIEQVGRESEEELFARAAGNACAALQAGITTVRDCGGKGNIVQRLRDRIRKGEVEGADIVSCGVPITITRGHCHWLGLIADTPAEVGRACAKMIAEDADWLKVMATGGNMTASSNPMRAQYDAATLLSIAAAGRAAGKHSAAHVLSRSAMPGAVAANFRTIEHCDWRVEEEHYEFDTELARRLADQGQFVGLTMSGLTRRAFLPKVRAATDFGPVRRLDIRFACERQMLDFGLRYTLHSDAGVRWTPIDRFDLGLQAAVIELKLTPAEVLTAVTRTAAEALDLPDRGTLVPGRRADLLIVRGDPLHDLACLSDVRAVMQRGRWVVR
jgi:imidazolonepropionase-like amidohydrolase